MNAHTNPTATAAPATTAALLRQLSEVEGNSTLGKLAEAVLEARNIRFDMREDDVALCEDGAMQIVDLAEELQGNLLTEIQGWGA